MLIDSSTVYNLELIQNVQNPQSTDSLFGLLNNTLTPMGVSKFVARICMIFTKVIGSVTTFKYPSALD